MMAARPGRWIVFTAIIAVAGCSEPDAVRVHDELPPQLATTPTIPVEKKKFRTLAAMVPADGEDDRATWWFFKMTGPTALIAKYEADFDKLFNTLQARTDPTIPITWELPPGWTQSEITPKSMRYVTLKSPGGEIEITVTHFGGTVLANALRWWGELWKDEKGPEFTQAMLPEYVQQRTVKGRLILRADMSGPHEPPKRPMMNPHGGMEK
jgi:hypothetical protein